MKILKHPIFEECTCERCGTVFQTDVNDKYETVFYGKNSFGWRIDCPLCHEWCDLDWAGMVNPSDGTDTNVGHKSEWISVDERLPDKDGRFLTVDKKGYMMVCYWQNRFGWFASVCNKNAITHWMPLPEPPKGGAE